MARPQVGRARSGNRRRERAYRLAKVVRGFRAWAGSANSPRSSGRADSDAVVVADAMAWEGADGQSAAAVAAGVPEVGRCFLRALVYRIVTDRLAGGDRPYDWQSPYRPAVLAACAIAADETAWSRLAPS